MLNKNHGASNVASVVVIVLIIAAGVIFTLTKDRTPEPQTNNNQSTTMGPVEVALNAQNDSGQTGTATVTEEAGKTKVVIEISNGSATPQPAHIHTGNCETLGAVRYPLSNVVNGRSETILQPTPHFLHGLGQLAINVHKSAAESSIYTSCGNLTEAFDRAMHQ